MYSSPDLTSCNVFTDASKCTYTCWPKRHPLSIAFTR